MAKPTSILDTLNALDAIADRGMAAASTEGARRPAETLRAVPRQPQPQPPRDGNEQLLGLFIELKRDIEELRREQTMQALPPSERQLYAMLADLRREISELKGHQDAPLGYDAPRAARHSHHRDAQAPRQMPPPQWTGTIRPDTLLWAVPLMLIAAVALYFLGRDLVQRPSRDTRAPDPVAITAAPVAAPATTVVQPSAAEGRTDSPLFDTLSIASVSPRGVSTEGVPSSQALAKANALLAAKGSARDTDEASFWLRHYVSMTLGEDQLVRALTMLGSTYAEPAAGKSPDYAAARQLWEMAGALGDPVALCFLGRLHEAGLSVPADAKVAAQWQQRANRLGGCASASTGK